ncbi:unnamed protein product [Cuscuta epithymum]|uniref:Uncharacterized protein n=1 Tax=Cuscuta epithymum TaxID=186058 RepID=A0AAV0EPZ1_9ASTE|nr:unnamed protein product [Cuscuta epithymum]
MQYDRPLSAIVPNSRSARPSLPGWRRTSYAVRSAPQRHRTQLTFSSSIPSRVATNVLCITISAPAPSCLFHVRIAPFPPGWRRTSYAVRSAPQRHRTQLTFSSSIPSRVATNVLCIMIGFSAPSCLFHVRIVHPFQGGDERLMHHDRLLSAIVSLSRSDRPSLPGWRRTSYASRSASQRHRVSFTFGSPHSLQDGDERLMQNDRPLSAIVSRFTVRLAHSPQDGDDRLMQYDRPLSAIVPSSRSARPSLPGWRRTSYASRSAP